MDIDLTGWSRQARKRILRDLSLKITGWGLALQFVVLLIIILVVCNWIWAWHISMIFSSSVDDYWLLLIFPMLLLIGSIAFSYDIEKFRLKKCRNDILPCCYECDTNNPDFQAVCPECQTNLKAKFTEHPVYSPDTMMLRRQIAQSVIFFFIVIAFFLSAHTLKHWQQGNTADNMRQLGKDLTEIKMVTAFPPNTEVMYRGEQAVVISINFNRNMYRNYTLKTAHGLVFAAKESELKKR